MKSYVFMTSANYSGSTLLSFLLDCHPQIASVGELSGPIRGMNMETYPCSCGARLVDCAFWSNVQKQMADQSMPFDFENFQTEYFYHVDRGFWGKALLYPFERKGLNFLKDLFFQLERRRISAVDRATDRCVAMAKIITSITGADHFFDTSKSHFKPKYLSIRSDINLKIIALIRDGRGYLCSYTKRRPNEPYERVVKNWAEDRRRTEIVLKQYVEADSILWVRYEDLCNNTEQTLIKIYDFIGVKHFPLTKPIDVKNHHIIGNKMRKKPIQEISLDEKWKRDLSKEQLAIFDGIAGATNRAYGYA